MELFKSFVSESEVKPLTVASGKIHQTQRNELKESATVGLLDLLQSNGVDAFRTISGVTMVIDNTVCPDGNERKPESFANDENA